MKSFLYNFHTAAMGYSWVLFNSVIFWMIDFLSVQYTEEKFGVDIISRQIQSQFPNELQRDYK